MREVDKERLGKTWRTYKTFLGLMTKHHRVQIMPVAISARFCCSERDSAGRVKSDAPAITKPHCLPVALAFHLTEFSPVWPTSECQNP